MLGLRLVHWMELGGKSLILIAVILQLAVLSNLEDYITNLNQAVMEDTLAGAFFVQEQSQLNAFYYSYEGQKKIAEMLTNVRDRALSSNAPSLKLPSHWDDALNTIQKERSLLKLHIPNSGITAGAPSNGELSNLVKKKNIGRFLSLFLFALGSIMTIYSRIIEICSTTKQTSNTYPETELEA